MKLSIDPQELARQFNEDDAVWREYDRLRQTRHRCGLTIPLPSDYPDWLRAEGKIRIIRCIGKGLP
jgi:hypothetical protein